MTVEQLLIPRYKVIADYPGCYLRVGRVYPVENSNDADIFPKYPHLFKKLEWWQERSKDDLPKYVRIGKFVWEVDRWREGVSDLVPDSAHDYIEPKNKYYLLLAWHHDKHDSRPATEQEYLDYINKYNP